VFSFASGLRLHSGINTVNPRTSANTVKLSPTLGGHGGEFPLLVANSPRLALRFIFLLPFSHGCTCCELYPGCTVGLVGCILSYFIM